MHIATRPDAAPSAAQPCPLVLKHHEFLKQGTKSLLDAGIICKNMSPCASPIIVVKTHPPEGLPLKFHLCINYRKLNSMLLAITPAVGTKKGALTLMSLPKSDELFMLLKGAKYFAVGTATLNWMRNKSHKVLSLQYLANSNF